MKTIKRYGAKGQEFILELEIDHYKKSIEHLKIYEEMLKRTEYQTEEHQKNLNEMITYQKKYINKLKLELNI